MKTTIIKKRDSIIIQYRVNGKQYRIYTGIRTPDSKWNKKNKSIIGNDSSSTSLNQLIVKYRDEAETYLHDLIRTAKEYSHELMVAHIKERFNMKEDTKPVIDLIYAFNYYINNKKDNYNPLTIRAYKNTLSHVKNAHINRALSIKLCDLNIEWFDRFSLYLKEELSHSPNTRGKQVKNIKTVLNYAYEHGLHDNLKFQLIKKEGEQSSNVYLSEKEIYLLLDTTYKTDADTRIVEVFAFICMTGIRFSDYASISNENFKKIDEYWHIDFQQEKTRNRVRVPIIYRRACEIIVKYNGDLPKYSNAYFNRELKDLFKRYNLFEEAVLVDKEQKQGCFPKRALISAHTGRRSFCTNQYLKNTPVSLIMAASGHTTEAAFRLYIKADSIEKAKKLVCYADY